MSASGSDKAAQDANRLRRAAIEAADVALWGAACDALRGVAGADEIVAEADLASLLKRARREVRIEVRDLIGLLFATAPADGYADPIVQAIIEAVAMVADPWGHALTTESAAREAGDGIVFAVRAAENAAR